MSDPTSRIRYLTRVAATGSAGILLVTLFRKGVNSLLPLLLAALLGAAGYGSYAFAMSALAILGSVSSFGLQTLCMREVARELEINANFDPFKMIAVFMCVVVALAVAVGSTVFLARPLYEPYLGASESAVLSFAILALPFIAVTRIIEGALIGLQWPVVGAIPEFVVRPVIIIGTLSVFYLALTSISTHQAIQIFLVAVIVACFIGVLLVRWAWPRDRTDRYFRLGARSLLKNASLMFMAEITYILIMEFSVIVLGFYDDAAQIGIFRLAMVLSTLVPMLLVTIRRPLSPIVARLAASDEPEVLQLIVTRFTRVGFLFGCLLAAGFIVFGKTVLGYFGEGFQQGYAILVILSLLQLAGISLGAGSMVLLMSGFEKDAAHATAWAAALNIVLSPTLIGFFGITGAALATGGSLLCWRALAMRSVKLRLGVRTSVF